MGDKTKNRNIDELSTDELQIVLKHILKKLNMVAVPNTESNSTSAIVNSQSNESDEDMSINGDGEEEFTEVRSNRKRQRISEKVRLIETSNKFELLTNESSENSTDSTQQTSKQSNQKQQQATNKSNNSPPPIVLRDKSKWIAISKGLKQFNINYTKAQTTSEGIRVFPSTENDYRRMYKFLDEQNIFFHTYGLKSEKNLKVVLRGVIQEASEQDIIEDLNDQGYPVLKFSRMLGKDRKPAPLVLIELNKDYKSIYDLKFVCGLSIVAEPLKIKDSIIQCHRCQLFGHSQKNCHAEFKCLKCGESHSTHTCQKPKTTPAICSNCGEEHTSAYIFCKENPNNPNLKKETQKQPSIKNAWTNPLIMNKSTSQNEPKPSTSQASSLTHPVKQQKSSDIRELSHILGEMLLQFSSTNSTLSQQTEFLKNTQKIISLFKSNNA